MKKKLYLFLLILAALFCSRLAFGDESYVLNFQDRSIVVSTDDLNLFGRVIQASSENVTYIPSVNQNVIFSLPFKDNRQGKMFVTDRDGYCIKAFELGYARFVKAGSLDHRHFLITYRVGREPSQYELAYYDAEKGELLKTPLETLTNVYDIKFSLTDNTAYILGLDRDNYHCLLSVDLNHFRLKSQFSLGRLPIPMNEKLNYTHHSKLYMLNGDKAVVLNDGGANPMDLSKTLPGRFVLVSLSVSKVVSEQVLPSEVYSQWYPKTKSLMIVARDVFGDIKTFHWRGHGLFIKVNGDGLQSFSTSNWWNYLYDEDTDCVYYLTNDQFGTHRFEEGTTQQWNVGANVYTQIVDNWVPSYPDGFGIIKNGGMAVCWNPRSGRVRLIDLHKQVVTMRLTGLSLKGKALEDRDGKTLIGYNSNYTRYYLLKTERLIQVLNEKFKVDAAIKLPDYVIGMYQTDSNIPMIITHRFIYRIDDDKLLPIYEFKRKIHQSYLLTSMGETFLLTDGELLHIDFADFSIQPMVDVSLPLDDKTLMIHGEQKEKLMHLPS